MGTLLSNRGARTNLFPFSNDNASPLIRCQPIYASSEDGGNLAIANNTGKSIVTGLVADTSVASAATGLGVAGGVMVASTDEWDAVCGTTGGLAFGVTYYLDPATPGRLTDSPPESPADDGDEVVPIITSLSATKARISIQPPILL